MALLIDVNIRNWISDDALASDVRAALPEADVRTYAELGNPDEITMLATVDLRADLPSRLSNLGLVQKLGAGVETIVAHPALPDHVRVTRLKPDAPAREIAEWFTSFILAEQRQHRFFQQAKDAAEWRPTAPLEAPKTTIAVLGLGHIGGRTAQMLAGLDFRVIGWSRSQKALPGIACFAEIETLPEVLGQADYVTAILPSTPATSGLFDAERLSQMKPGSMLLNAGRGDLIDQDALLEALDSGTPGRAVLDVVTPEPLPATSPLWAHPKATITPHVSGWHLGDALKDVAENYRRLCTGGALLHEVDRIEGY